MTGVSVQADNPVYKEAYTESILVVMANDGIQHMVGDIFMGKYKIIKADTSQEAIEIVDEKKDSLCLVLTEMYANGINGFDLLDYMRKMDYIDNVPVVFLSGEYIAPKVIRSPQEAFYAEKKSLQIRETSGCISGEFVMCYPPGIPILAPGERITGEILDYIEYAKSKGCSMTGPEDPKIEHINILTDGGKPHGIMV